ncbi:hypothetical protein B0T14DRAFT_211663 [Immersiella caudata]|uniref:Uncharacterized protein n=1 Tax=Immersiella caudata TaxID=314043 RepID=A0AA39WQG7_9PEZI|nr:hypothetical protein B0T14DRAFT_211663 [Immersiella caudata]
MVGGSGSRTGFHVWFCCHCGDGPYTTPVSLSCSNPTCFHYRCHLCLVEKVKFPRNREEGSASTLNSWDPTRTANSSTYPGVRNQVGEVPVGRAIKDGHHYSSRLAVTDATPSGQTSQAASVPLTPASPVADPQNTEPAAAENVSLNLSLNLSDKQARSFVQALAKRLCEDSGVGGQGLQAVASQLPDLLQTFALRAVAERGSPESTEAGELVRKYESRITSSATRTETTCHTQILALGRASWQIDSLSEYGAPDTYWAGHPRSPTISGRPSQLRYWLVKS